MSSHRDPNRMLRFIQHIRLEDGLLPQEINLDIKNVYEIRGDKRKTDGGIELTQFRKILAIHGDKEQRKIARDELHQRVLGYKSKYGLFPYNRSSVDSIASLLLDTKKEQHQIKVDAKLKKKRFRRNKPEKETIPVKGYINRFSKADQEKVNVIANELQGTTLLVIRGFAKTSNEFVLTLTDAISDPASKLTDQDRIVDVRGNIFPTSKDIRQAYANTINLSADALREIAKFTKEHLGNTPLVIASDIQESFARQLDSFSESIRGNEPNSANEATPTTNTPGVSGHEVPTAPSLQR